MIIKYITIGFFIGIGLIPSQVLASIIAIKIHKLIQQREINIQIKKQKERENAE